MYIGSIKYLNQAFRLSYDQAQALLNSGKVVDVSVKEHKVTRSSAQNNYYWLFNVELASFLDESGVSYGEYKLPYTSELVHEINKKVFGVKSTTKLSKLEFCDYMTKLMSFWTERTNGQFMMTETPYSYLEFK